MEAAGRDASVLTHGTGVVNTSFRVDRSLVVRRSEKIVTLIFLPKQRVLDVVIAATLGGVLVLLILLLVLFVLFLVLLLFLLILITPVLVLVLLVFLVLLLVLLILLVLSLFAFLLGLLVLRQDVRSELVAHIDHLLRTARGTLVVDHLILDLVLCLWQMTVGTAHKLVNVPVDQILQDLVRVGSVHHSTVRVGVVRRLRSQFTTKELGHLTGLPVQTERNVGNVGNDSLDAVPAALNLSKHGRHLVPVFRVIHWRCASNVDDCPSSNRHGRHL